MDKNEIIYNSFQVVLFNYMDSVNNIYANIYCPEDDENRVCCDFCDKLCIERFYENQLKPGTHTINIRKREKKSSFSM